MLDVWLNVFVLFVKNKLQKYKKDVETQTPTFEHSREF